MSDLHGTFAGFESSPVPSSEAVTASETVTPAEPQGPDNDGFDRSRVLRLLERLERDIAAVETAMVQAEAGEHDAFAATVAALEPQLVD